MAQFKPRGSVDYFIGGYQTRNSEHITFSEGFLTQTANCSYGNYRIRIGADYQYKQFSVFFDQHTYMLYDKGFTPVVTDYFCGIKYRVTKEIEAKYEHLCRHPTDAAESLSRQFGGYDMVSVSYGY